MDKAQECKIIEEFQQIDDQYAVMDYMGAGAYGIVCAVKERRTDKSFAIKKCKNIFNSRTIAKRTLREIRLLRFVKHPLIVELKKVFIADSAENFTDLYLAFELMETDLAQVIKSSQVLRIEHIQHFMYQILSAVQFLHEADIIHRDLKPRNILVNSDCTLKLADFGLARVFHDGIDNTSLAITEYVTTRWYRAPEILAGWSAYGKAIDLWAVGCILGELIKRSPLFPGADSVKQLELLLTILGRPTESFIIKCRKSSKRLFLRSFEFPRLKPLDQLIADTPPYAKDLILKLLSFDPIHRPSAAQCLKHQFFYAYPKQTIKSFVPIQIPSMAFEHEKWKPLVEEYKSEILKEVEDFHMREEFELSADSLSIETDNLCLEETEEFKDMSPTIQNSNLQSLKNSSADSSTITSEALASRSTRVKSTTSSKYADTVESSHTTRKLRNWSRDTIVEDFVMPTHESSKTTKASATLENKKIITIPAKNKVKISSSLLNASCQVSENDFPKCTNQEVKADSKSKTKSRYNARSAIDLFSCGFDSKMECDDETSEKSRKQQNKASCIIC